MGSVLAEPINRHGIALDNHFRSVIGRRRYLFHLHTTFSDGVSTVAEYCAYAQANGYRVLVFTEHVRKRLDYDWYEYLDAIARAGWLFPSLEIWTGCEAKVLLDGTLDMPDDLPGLDLVCMAEHGDYVDRGQWTKALLGAFDLGLGVPLVWVHPFRWLMAQEHHIADMSVMMFLLAEARLSKVIIETMSERKKRLLRQSRGIMGLQLDAEVLDTLDEEVTIVGQDAHSVDNLD